MSRNATLIVHSFTTTPDEILAEFEAQTNQKWDVKHTSLDRLKQLEKQAYQVSSPMATAFTLRRIWTEGGTLYKFYDDGLLVQFEPQSLKQQVALSIKKQNAQTDDVPVNIVKKSSAL